MKKILMLLSASLLVASCGSTQKMDKVALKKVKKVAFVVYSVPEKIKFRENPKSVETKMSLTQVAGKVLAEATNGEGEFASDLSYDQFVNHVNKSKNLGWKVLTKKQLKKNKAFNKVASNYRKSSMLSAKKQEEGKSGWMRSISSITGVGENKHVSSSPKHLPSFGLITDWGNGNALKGTAEEKEYINKVLKELNVDAVLVINDMGYSFKCKACVGGTGTASTGSAFHATLVGKDSKVLMEMNQWFSYTDESTATTAGVVNPMGQKALYKAHGRKLASVFEKQYLETLNEKD